MVIIARDFETSNWIEIEIRGGIIVAVRPGDGPSETSANDDSVGPAFWDIQLNGRWGHSFSSPESTVEQVVAIVRAQGSLGTARLCPTLITAPPGQMLHGVRTIAAACDADPETARKVLGIHLEGPFLSHREGYREAHPADARRDPDIELFDELQDASGGANRTLDTGAGAARRGGADNQGLPVRRRDRAGPHGGRWPDPPSRSGGRDEAQHTSGQRHRRAATAPSQPDLAPGRR